MLGEKARLEHKVETLQAEVDELGVLAPYLDAARVIHERHLALFEEPELGKLNADAFEVAVQSVWDETRTQVRDELAASIRGEINEHETPKIRAAVEAEEGDALRAAAEARFEADRPGLTAIIAEQVRQEEGHRIREEVFSRRRQELEVTIREQEVPRLTAEAGALFDTRLETERATILAKVAAEIAKLTPDQRREELANIVREAELSMAVARDQIQLERRGKELQEEVRIQTIAEKARVAKRLDIADLKAGELVAVALAYKEEVTRDVVPKQQRVLYFTIVDPKAGTALLMRDNWIGEKDLLRKSLALPDGCIYEIGTKLIDGQVATLDAVIRRSLPLTLRSAGAEVLPKGVSEELEVSEVFLGGNLNTLVSHSETDRYGHPMKPVTKPVNTDLFALASDKKIAYRFLV